LPSHDTALARKLVEIGQLRNSDLLDNWYEKALSFERSRKEVIEEGKLWRIQKI